jgi:hypothetical protein
LLPTDGPAPAAAGRTDASSAVHWRPTTTVSVPRC